MEIKAVIFDWGRTLYDSIKKKEFSEAYDVLEHCRKRGYRLAVVSLVTGHANSTLEERKNAIEQSPLRKYFEIALVTDKDKDDKFDEVVAYFNLPRTSICIIDDRVIRGIRYGNFYGHPTIWFQNGKFANELPDKTTGIPTYTITSLGELLKIL